MATTVVTFTSSEIATWNLPGWAKRELGVRARKASKAVLADQGFAATGLRVDVQKKPARIRIEVDHDGASSDAQVRAMFNDPVPANAEWDGYPDPGVTEDPRFVAVYVQYRVDQANEADAAEIEEAKVDAMRAGPWESWDADTAAAQIDSRFASMTNAQRAFIKALWAHGRTNGLL